MPEYSNQDYYDLDLQLHIHNFFRSVSHGKFDELSSDLSMLIKKPPFSVLVRGVDFDQHHRQFVAINRIFGSMVAIPYNKNNPRAQLIHYLEPHTDRNIIGRNSSSLLKVSEKLHVDGADRPAGLSFVSMQCVRADSQQGKSQILDMAGLRACLKEASMGQNTIEILETQSIPWKAHHSLGGGVFWEPILQGDCIRWNRDIIDSSLSAENAPLSEATYEALDSLELALIENTRHVMELNLQPGDLLLIDNRRCLHSRSPITDPNSQRLMLRSWIE